MILKTKNNDLLDDPKIGHILTKAIIDTIGEPLIILDEKLRVIAASKSFYKKFGLDIDNVRNKLFYSLGNREWDVPALRKLLNRVISKHESFENFEVSHKFSKLGHRTMLVNSREIRYKNGKRKMLLSIFDITEQRKLEREKENLAKQKDILLKEMRHRIANSLQIIASILLLKAQNVKSKETRFQLEDAHERIMSVATVQGHLDPAGLGKNIEVAAYLTALCQSLAKSMIGNRRPLSIKVNSGPGKVTSDEAIGLGLITTELVINALKHAFILKKDGEVVVEYEAKKFNWKLVVEDNGQGMSNEEIIDRKGLGTGIIDSLAKRLDAKVKIESSPAGTAVSITHNRL